MNQSRNDNGTFRHGKMPANTAIKEVLVTGEPSGELYMKISGLCAKLGGMSKSTVWLYIHRGLLPKPIKMGRSSLFIESEVDAAINKLAQQRNKNGK